MAAGLSLSCGGGGGLTAPTSGAVQVTTSTTGAEPDPDGYSLTLDDIEIQPIGTVATATLRDIEPGAHRVGLAGLAPNCTVEGDNPRTVNVTAGETAVQAIAIICAEPPPATGGISVTTTTAGPRPIPTATASLWTGTAGVRWRSRGAPRSRICPRAIISWAWRMWPRTAR